MSPAREAWRLNKAAILKDLALCGRSWDVQSGLRFTLRLRISEGVPLCQIVCGEEILVAGALC